MFPTPQQRLAKDRAEIILKFNDLIEKMSQSCSKREASDDGMSGAALYFEVRTSALNLLARITGHDNVYVSELQRLHERDIMNPWIVKGILQAALLDYTQGFIADHKLLITAEVFADFLIQAEVLLDNDYKDAAAVIIRAVLEDGLRRVCLAKGITIKDRDGVHQLSETLTRQNLLTAVQFKEIQAKKEIGNHAAHGKFGEYTKQDVVAFHEFVQRLLATIM